MTEFEHHNPDDFWQKAFDEAAETPPPRVWDAIEHRLDESDEAVVLPLWGLGLASRPLTWGVGIAAAVALLLAGWWLVPSSVEQPVARQSSPAASENVAMAPTPKAANSKADPSTQPAGKRGTESEATESLATLQTPAKPATNQPSLAARTTPSESGRESLARVSRRVEPFLNEQQTRTSVAEAVRAATSLSPPAGQVSSAAFLAVAQRDAGQPADASQTAPAFDPLTGQPLRIGEARPIQRIVWVSPADALAEPERVQPKHKPRELWASVSMMPGAFDPSVSVRSAAMTTANSLIVNGATSNASSVSSRASFSIAYQAGAGLQLGEHWSVESGVGYLAGRSTVESPALRSAPSVQLITVKQPGPGNSTLFVDALHNSVHPGTVTASSPSASLDYTMTNNSYTPLYDGQTRQSLTNDYQYVQVPVQVGYQLRPRKRLGLALLGGLLTNIFVRNTVGNELVITASDGVYRPLSWAATVGARLRYRPSRQWSASLAGVYQPTLGAGSRPASQVQSHPTSAGMSFGIDYHF